MKITNARSTAALLCILAASTAAWAVGESAVITLIFPPGARATGLGEAFAAVSDDVNATFFNPAGLGQPPLANAWRAHLESDKKFFSSIVARRRKSFGMKERIWAGTDKGILQYNGKVWSAYDMYLIELDETLEHIAEKFIEGQDKDQIRRAIRILKEENNIEQHRSRFIRDLVSPALLDSTQRARERSLDEIVQAILDFDAENRSATRIYGLIANRVDSSKADQLADTLATVYSIPDTRFEDLVELKVPFRIAVDDSVTAMAMDNADRLWVGTARGLWRYDGGRSWRRYSAFDGLPSENILAITTGSRSQVAIATDRGIAVLSDGDWTVPANQPQDWKINAVTFGKEDAVFVGTDSGLYRWKSEQWTSFDTTDGLLSTRVSALMADEAGNLWIGGENGVSVYEKTSWKRYKFPDSRVYAIAEYEPGRVWIGTNRGAISYQKGHTRIGPEGERVDEPPTWKLYHSKNALKGDVVRSIAVHGDDLWLVTEEAINQYDFGEQEFLVFYEPLLPAFNIPDLWHMYTAGVIPTEDWGTVGFSVNYINFGEIEHMDAHGRHIGRMRSWEAVFGLSYGLPIKQDLSVGLNIKYAHSALAPGYGDAGEGIGQTFAVDLGLLKHDLLIDNLSLGLNIQNMGPSIYYISQDEADPIPFNIKLGLAYKVVESPLHDLQFLADVNREIVKPHLYGRPDPFYKALWSDFFEPIYKLTLDRGDEEEIEEAKEQLREDFIGHVAMEYWYVDFLALRAGYMHDKSGSRREVSLGIGLKYGNLGFDGSYIHSPGQMSVARHGQWRISLIMRV